MIRIFGKSITENGEIIYENSKNLATIWEEKLIMQIELLEEHYTMQKACDDKQKFQIDKWM